MNLRSKLQPVDFTTPAQSRLVATHRKPASVDFVAPVAAAAQTSQPLKNFRTIAVLLDGTTYAEHALPHALAVARRSGASLRLIRAFSGPQTMELGLGFRSADRDQQHYLADVARRIARVDNVPLDTIVLNGADPVAALARGASGAELVILASRRRSLVSSLWSSSTFDALRQRLPVPLQLTKGYSSPVDLTADPLPRNILVPLDGSIQSRSIVDYAATFARLEGATLTLLNIQNEEWTRGFFEHTNPLDYLRTVLRMMKATSSFVEAHVISTDRSPAQAIAAFAAQNGIDLIALATRADGGLSRLMRGSVADSLIRQTKLPVLVRNFDERPQRRELTTVS